MRITPETKYADFIDAERYISDDTKRAIEKAAEAYYKPCELLNINEFWGIINGNFEILGDITDPSVMQVYWKRRFDTFCKEFAKQCEALKVEQTPEQAKASAGCKPISPQENMLIFVRSYFGMHSFIEAAEKITLAEYLTAKRDKYNEHRIQTNFLNQQKAKTKRK